MINEHNYLTNIPQSAQEYGLAKVLLVRRELIHIKHIFTEVFTRKSISIEDELARLDLTVVDYMEYMTHRMRYITKFSRQFAALDIHDVNGIDRNNFFPFYSLVSYGRILNNCIVLDFDGVCTKSNFRQLYQLCCKRSSNVIICSANPTINKEWFIKNGLSKPSKIFACKGKIKKIKKLIELGQKYDFVFYIDDEEEYLKYAWLFGIQTYRFVNNKIVYFSRKTK